MNLICFFIFLILLGVVKSFKPVVKAEGDIAEMREDAAFEFNIFTVEFSKLAELGTHLLER